MARFKQLLKVLFLTEEHIIHNAHSPGNTANWSFSLINGCTVWGTPQRKALQPRPGAVSARLPHTKWAGEWSQGPPITLKTSSSVA